MARQSDNSSDHGDIPRTLKGYQLRNSDGTLIGFLGEGGFGRTYRATMEEDDGEPNHYAIKIPKKLKDESRIRLIQELNTLTALEHPNVVGNHGVLTPKEFGLAIPMDLCQGGNLRELLRKVGKIGENAALEIILQAAEGLEAAHTAGFIHRDVKPENLLVSEELPSDLAGIEAAFSSENLTVKVADFGLAVSAEDQLEPRGGGASGTPRYKSPEQNKNEKNLLPSSDLYSLGLTFWELLEGNYPFRGLGDKELRKRHDPSTPPHTIPEDLASPAARSLLERMLEKDRTRRIQTAHEVINEILKILGREPKSDDSLPVAAAAPALSSATQGEVMGDEEFGVGLDSDFYTDSNSNEFRSRPMGDVREATLTDGNNEVIALTKWSLGFEEIGSDLERELQLHLRKLHSFITTDTNGTLLGIVDLRRTQENWCLAEEWSPRWVSTPPLNLQATLSLRKKPLTVEEASIILEPLVEVCDRAYGAGFNLPLNLEEILLDGGDLNLEEIIDRPLTEWPSVRVRCSGFALPEKFITQIKESASLAGTLSGYSSGIDASAYDSRRSFCRLLYRIIEGSDVPVEAEWDPTAYIEASRLSGASNVSLKDWISESSDPPPADQILREICKNEGIYRRDGSLASRSQST
ncbi:MAG: serine/threonine-protein kinase, partial [Verrucomicrobiota bacterium]